MKRLIYAITVFAISFTACVPSYLWPVCEYFIEHYYDIAEHPTMKVLEKDGYMAIKCDVACNPGYRYFTSEYKRIAEELGDTEYAKVGEKTETGNPGRGFYSAYPVISAIDITSNAEWDEKHKAGASLADCFDISYVSFAEYIDSGYDSKKFNTISERKTKPLSELASDDLRFIRANNNTPIYLLIKNTPSADKNHTLTVQFMLHDSTTRESTIEIEFP